MSAGRIRVALCVALLACLLAGPSRAQPRPAPLDDDELQAAVAPWARRMGTAAFAFGCGREVSSCGDPAFLRSMPYASITKQFVAALVLRLRERGVLRLSDRLSQYGFGIPGDRDITLESLLTHTSGLADYFPSKVGRAQMGEAITWDQLLAKVRRRQVESPGKMGEYAYSNTNYLLLGRICEQVGGAPLSSLLAESVFRPLGLKCTLSCQPPLDESWLRAAAGAEGSAEDLARWGLALAARSGAVLSRSSWGEMIRSRSLIPPLPRPLTPAAARGIQRYGYGVMVGELGLYRMVYHTGILPVPLGAPGRFSFVGANPWGGWPRSFVAFSDQSMEGRGREVLANALTATFAASEAKGWTEWILSGPEASEVHTLVRLGLLPSGIEARLTTAGPALRQRLGSLQRFVVLRQDLTPTSIRFLARLEGSAGSATVSVRLGRGGRVEECVVRD